MAAELVNNQEAQATVAADPVWSALIHHHGGRFSLASSGLLLSDAQNPLAELKASLSSLQLDPAFHCRFPARYAFLKERFSVDAAPAGLACPALDEFRERVPADRISLVFVAENLEQPSSIMGHLFLKVAGESPSGETREHAISFFTDPIGLNFPLYLYQGMVSGMPGYFSLTPYREHVRTYVHSEQRSLWEYELSLDAEQRERLRLHLYEMRPGRYRYLFSSYNCATLVLELLGVARPELLSSPQAWVTPKEVVRIAKQHQVIATTTALFPSATAAAIYAPALDSKERERVIEVVSRAVPQELSLEVAAERKAVANNFALATLDMRQRRGLLDTAEAQKWRDAFLAAGPELDIGFDESTRYNPSNSPSDLRISVGWHLDFRKTDRLELRWLPVSHQLTDDNRNYLHESELRLFEVSLSASRARHLRIEQLTLFSALSLRPMDGYSGPLSTFFQIAWRRGLDLSLGERGTLDIGIGRGLTSRVGEDVDAFALAVGTVRFGAQAKVDVQPRIGTVMRLAWNLKAVGTWQGSGTSDGAALAEATLAWFPDPRTAFKLIHREVRGTAVKKRTFGVELMRGF